MLKSLVKVFLGILILIPLLAFVFYTLDSNKRLLELQNKSRLVETALGPMEYQIIGEEGPVLLYLHGTPGGYDLHWSLEGMRILVPSRPGYLRTQLALGRTPAEQAAAVAALLDVLNIDSAAVLGMSGGGPVALTFAAHFPGKTEALILLEAVSQAPPVNQGKVLAYLKSDVSSWFFISWLEHFVDAESVLESFMPDEANRRLILEDPAKLELIYRALWKFWPVSGRTQGHKNDWQQFQSLSLDKTQISVPTLILHGDQDIHVEVEQSYRLAQQVPNSRLEVIQGADHFMLISHGQILDKKILNFLSELDSTQYDLE